MNKNTCQIYFILQQLIYLSVYRNLNILKWVTHVTQCLACIIYSSSVRGEGVEGIHLATNASDQGSIGVICWQKGVLGVRYKQNDLGQFWQYFFLKFSLWFARVFFCNWMSLLQNFDRNSKSRLSFGVKRQVPLMCMISLWFET